MIFLEGDNVCDNDVDINMTRQTSVVVDQNFHQHLSTSNDQLTNEGHGNYEYEEDEREIEEELGNIEQEENKINRHNYNDDHEVPIPSGLAAEAEGEGGLSMTYLDEYFDEYADDFASGPLPSEAIGLDGVSPEKQPKGCKDLRYGDGDDYRHGDFDETHEARIESEQMLPAELGVHFTESLTLDGGDQGEDDRYLLDEFDHSREEEVPTLASPNRTSSEPHLVPKELTYTQPAPPERKSAAMERVLEVGEKVQGKYDGGIKWYAGVIAAVNNDGTYDIQYNDGDFESGVISSFIRAAASKTSSLRAQAVVRTVRTLEPAIKKRDHNRTSLVPHRASTPKLSRMNSQVDDDDDHQFSGCNGQQKEREEEDIELNEEIDEAMPISVSSLEPKEFNATSPKSRDEYSIDFEDDDGVNKNENMLAMLNARAEHTYEHMDINDNFEAGRNENYKDDETLIDLQKRILHYQEEEEKERIRREEEQFERINDHNEELKLQTEIEINLEKDRIETKKKIEKERQIEEERLKQQEQDRQEREKIVIAGKQLEKQLLEVTKRKKHKDKDKDSESSHHYNKATNKKRKERKKSKHKDDMQYEVEKVGIQNNATFVENEVKSDDEYFFDDPTKDAGNPHSVYASEFHDHMLTDNNGDYSDNKHEEFEHENLVVPDDAEFYEDDFEF